VGRLRLIDSPTRPTGVREWTRLTGEACQRLALPFEAAFQAHLAPRRLDGRPRPARRYTTRRHGPLPMPTDPAGQDVRRLTAAPAIRWLRATDAGRPYAARMAPGAPGTWLQGVHPQPW
jgi:hypothetical protein